MEFKKLSDTYRLNNGYSIPCIGFGTWQTPDGKTAINAVKSAVSCGYRHIDTAAAYGNETSVGQGIAACGVDRSELFVTSKLWNTQRGYDKTLKAFEQTMADLQLDYLDMYLIHWPQKRQEGIPWEEINAQTWKAMEKLYLDGRVKAIGVSNFLTHHLEALLDRAQVMPAVNQIEFHPGQIQEEVWKFCQKNDILVEAWSPLGTGRMLQNPILMEIAAGYGKSVAQLCIRWCLQNGVLPLPKSITPVRIEENTHVFDFEISREDMERINAMEYCGGSGLHPDQIDF